MSGERDGRATYRFDPHDEGIWLGLGIVRLALVCGSLGLGAVCVYAGQIVPALVLLLLVPPVVLARWDGLPLLAWIPLRLAYRVTGPREWAPDPERVGFLTPLTAGDAAVADYRDPSDLEGDIEW
ncbi:hypothetical protein ACVU7I_08250 [Patulibacter sp. S7RM1-6]